jgi:hypothetical protein
MGNKHERPSKRHAVAYARAGRKLAGPGASNPQSRDGTIENYGLKSEGLYVSKLGRAKIIPIAEQKIFRWRDGMERSSDPSLAAGDNHRRRFISFRAE